MGIIVNNLSTAGASAANDIGNATGGTTGEKINSLLPSASTSGAGKVQLASTGEQNLSKVPRATGSEIASILTAGGYSVAPASGLSNLDNIADGTTYKRIIAAKADRVNSIRLSKAKHKLEYDFLLTPQKLVITGDSLSYNRYSFDSTARTNAYDCYPGMKSWSFMIRNYRAALNYKSSNSFNFYTQVPGGYSNYTVNSSIAYLLPFSNEYVSVDMGLGTEVSFTFYHDSLINTISFNESCKYYLHTVPSVGAPSGKFDIYLNGVFQWTISTTASTNWQGWEITSNLFNSSNLINGENLVLIKNARNVDDSPLTGSNYLKLIILGLSNGSFNSTIFTGQGSTTSSWLVSNIDSRVLQYNPDAVIIIMGANDKATSVPASTFFNNMSAAIEAMLINNPNMKILLLTFPPFSPGGETRDLAADYLDAYYTLEEKYQNVYLVDLFTVFEGISLTLWRYDNVHFNHFGNKLLFETLARKYSAGFDFCEKLYNAGYFNPDLTYTGGNYNKKLASLESPQVYTLNTSTLSLTRLDNNKEPSILRKAYKSNTPEGGSYSFLGYTFYTFKNLIVKDILIRPIGSLGLYTLSTWSWLYYNSQGSIVVGIGNDQEPSFNGVANFNTVYPASSTLKIIVF